MEMKQQNQNKIVMNKMFFVEIVKYGEEEVVERIGPLNVRKAEKLIKEGD